jgi:hypothetical protein
MKKLLAILLITVVAALFLYWDSIHLYLNYHADMVYLTLIMGIMVLLIVGFALLIQK